MKQLNTPNSVHADASPYQLYLDQSFVPGAYTVTAEWFGTATIGFEVIERSVVRAPKLQLEDAHMNIYYGFGSVGGYNDTDYPFSNLKQRLWVQSGQTLHIHGFGFPANETFSLNTIPEAISHQVRTNSEGRFDLDIFLESYSGSHGVVIGPKYYGDFIVTTEASSFPGHPAIITSIIPSTLTYPITKEQIFTIRGKNFTTPLGYLILEFQGKVFEIGISQKPYMKKWAENEIVFTLPEWIIDTINSSLSSSPNQMVIAVYTGSLDHRMMSNPVSIAVLGGNLSQEQPPTQFSPTSQAQPWGLSASAGDGQVILTWQAQQPPAGKTLRGYYIYRSTMPGQAVMADRINDFPSLQTSWTDTTVQNGQQYYYVVRPVYNDGTTGPASEEVPAVPQAKRNVTIQLTIGNPTAYVNGQARELIIPPRLQSGRALLPLRFIGEAAGASLDWEPTEQRVTYSLGDHNVTLWVGRTEAIVNGQYRTLDVAPILTNGVTLVPVRFVTEALGFRVDWYADTRSILIQR